MIAPTLVAPERLDEMLQTDEADTAEAEKQLDLLQDRTTDFIHMPLFMLIEKRALKLAEVTRAIEYRIALLAWGAKWRDAVERTLAEASDRADGLPPEFRSRVALDLQHGEQTLAQLDRRGVERLFQALVLEQEIRAYASAHGGD
jgi:hypothetical protein